jgi:hypothetical protein
VVKRFLAGRGPNYMDKMNRINRMGEEALTRIGTNFLGGWLDESQRDSGPKPRVGESASPPWVRVQTNLSTATRLRPPRFHSSRPTFATTPLGLIRMIHRLPRVARASQPLGFETQSLWDWAWTSAYTG